jgi:hypothetical protein
MTKIIFIIFSIFVLTNCGYKSEKIDLEKIKKSVLDTISTIKIVRHKNLLWTKEKFLAEWVGENDPFDSIRKIASKKQFTFENFGDYIVASAYFKTDACGSYVGNIDVNNDTIYLKFDLTSTTICSALAYYKVDYLINNETLQKYKVKIKN